VKPEDWSDEDDGEWEPALVQKKDKHESFMDFAKSYMGEHVKFGFTYASAVLTKYNKKNAIILFNSPRWASVKHGDKLRARYGSNTINEDTLSDFIRKKSRTLVSKHSDSLFPSDLGQPVLCLFLGYDFVNNLKGTNYYINRMRKVAKEYQGKIIFTVAQKSEVDGTYRYGLKLGERWDDVGVGIQDTQGSYFKMEGKFGEEQLRAFASSFLSGKLNPVVEPDEREGESGEERGELDL